MKKKMTIKTKTILQIIKDTMDKKHDVDTKWTPVRNLKYELEQIDYLLFSRTGLDEKKDKEKVDKAHKIVSKLLKELWQE
jgi:predicted small secreted protein